MQGSFKSASPPRNANSESKDTCSGSERTIHLSNGNNNNHATSAKVTRRSPEAKPISNTGPKVIYHTIQIEDDKKSNSTESQYQSTVNTPKPQPRKLSEAHVRHHHGNEGRPNGIDQQRSNCNDEEPQAQLPHLSSRQESRSQSRETTPLLSVPPKLSFASESSTQDKVKQLARSSRSPSPAAEIGRASCRERV